MTHLIIDASDMDSWSKHHAGGLLVPAHRRPTVLQADRAAGEREVLRLAQQHPHGMFVLFAPVALAKRVPEVTHVNVRGEPVATSQVVRLLVIGEPDDIPF